MTVKTVLNRWTAMLMVSVMLLSGLIYMLCSLPLSVSWLHEAVLMDGEFEIGKIDFWFYNREDTSVPVELAAYAPTRFFTVGDRPSGAEKDENFDKTVNVHTVTGSNKGDVVMNVDITYFDTNDASNEQFYYFIVPIDNTNDNYRLNFMAGKYEAYLNTLFDGLDMSTAASRRTNMRAINDAHIQKVQKIRINKGQNQVNMFYILFWQEYDTMNWIEDTMSAPYTYRSIQYPITLRAHAYQDHMG